MADVVVRPARLDDRAAWRDMRAALYGEDPSHLPEIEDFFAGRSAIAAVFIATAGEPVGFIELSLRNYAEGCGTSPVAYVEGLHVEADHRRRKIGRALMRAAEAWAKARGHSELASDTQLGNDTSLAAHKAYGFTEVERIICFRKDLK
ncbi:MAG: N-acetyltransferase family protein [Parvibaculaceae bacterium]